MRRRDFLAAPSFAAVASAARPAGVLVDTHIHLFDPARFPYHANATYKPPAATLDDYKKFVAQIKLDHTIIVHPEPYQDDHSYLEYCFANEPRPGFFKGTCLFDPIDPKTPDRMGALAAKNKNRIVALRVHANWKSGAPSVSGPIRDRDLRHRQMKITWTKARVLGLAVQMHFIPRHAVAIGDLIRATEGVRVILDHLARAGEGTAAEYEDVLKLARAGTVYMKYSGVRYSSRQEYPHDDVKPLIRRVYDAFGPERIIWGGLGHTAADFERQSAMLDSLFAFTTEAERAKIRGGNAMALFGFTT